MPVDDPETAPAPAWPRLLGRAGALLTTTGRHLVAATVATARRRNGQRGALRDRLPGLFMDLGPTFVKGGQLLSTRRDLLPRSWCEALGVLHDHVAPMTVAETELALATAYPTGWPFGSFEWRAVASGSIACVHRAVLRDGREVAVKLRRPGIRGRMLADLALLQSGARLVQRLPRLRRVPVTRIVAQVGGAVVRQLDLVREAESLAGLRANLTAVPSFRVPAPVPAACGPGALVMEFVPGLRRFGRHELDPTTRKELVRNVLRGVYRMLFLDGLVHCDMHPGNLYLTPSGEVVLLDAGFVVALPDSVRRLFAEFFLNMALGRGDECGEVVLRSADDIPADADVERFRREIADLVGSVSGASAGQFQLAPFAARLFDLQRGCGVAAAPEFVFPLMSLLVLEGMVNDFDADVNFQAEAVPVLLTALRSV
ncbi:hypothetical protein GCM10012275_36340 [Longimycelium tulufanense]|uniref:Protein kinase domain-containing protein n=1 Tax=Longimycelium tulufanense TaxID=907463 RepID=A0A8J3C9S9_9PSEU|nr:AarF/UbiB family protein [Longimycelium tulufanense]GGM62336.1 hypothetical protein GCM10012275_36340 [Longimycelium tulufanense]